MRGFPAWLETPGGATLFSGIIVFAVMLAIVANSGFHLSRLLVMGDLWKAPDSWTEGFFFTTHTGYDAQFFYFMAYDPLILRENHQYIDNPPYRYGRILFPLMIRIAGMGTRTGMMAATAFLPFFALLGGAFLLARFAASNGASPLIAALYGLAPPLIYSVTRSLSEPVAYFFIILGALAYYKDKHLQAALWLMLAALTKEIALVAAAGFFLWSFFNGERRRAFYYWLAPAAYFSWCAYVYFRLAEWPFLSAGKTCFCYPLTGLFCAMTWQCHNRIDYGSQFFRSAYTFWLLAVTLFFIYNWRLLIRERIRTALCLTGVMVVCYCPWVFAHKFCYPRSTGFFVLFVFLFAAKSGNRFLYASFLFLVVNYAWFFPDYYRYIREIAERLAGG